MDMRRWNIMKYLLLRTPQCFQSSGAPWALLKNFNGEDPQMPPGMFSGSRISMRGKFHGKSWGSCVFECAGLAYQDHVKIVQNEYTLNLPVSLILVLVLQCLWWMIFKSAPPCLKHDELHLSGSMLLVLSVESNMVERKNIVQTTKQHTLR